MGNTLSIFKRIKLWNQSESTLDENLSSDVFNNPYILIRILKSLDIRTLNRCSSVSSQFLKGVVSENESRKDIIHLYLLNHIQRRVDPHIRDVPNLFESFRHFTQIRLNMKPKTVFVMIGGYRQKQIDYRHKVMKQLGEHLPKSCQIVYLDVGHNFQTSLISSKTLTNWTDNQSFQSTGLPCMSCLLIPDFDGVHVNTYNTVESINTKDVKCVVFFKGSKFLNRMPFEMRTKELDETQKEISLLIERLGHNVSFGGGVVVGAMTANRSSSKEYLSDFLREQLIITFSGDGVNTASSVISTENEDQFLPQLIELKRGLDFDCDQLKTSITFCFLFSNEKIFTNYFRESFSEVFPSVILYSFDSTDSMYGKHFTSKDTTDLNRSYRFIDPMTTSVIVLVNIEINKF